MMKTIGCVAIAIALTACGKNEPVPVIDPAQSQPKTIAPSDAKRAVLKIKGLFVGMDIQAVPDAYMDMLSQQQLSNLGFTEVIKYDNGEHCVLLYDKQFLKAIEARMRERYDMARAQRKTDEQLQSSCYASDGVLVVKAGVDGKVNKIEFNAVGELFNAQKLPPLEFAKLLVNEYKIPVLKPNETRNGWSYVGADGIKLEVLDRKVFGVTMPRLIMSRVAE